MYIRIYNIYLFEGLPDTLRAGVVDGVAQPLEGTPDGLSVLRLEVPLVGCLRRLGGDSSKVLQYPQQLEDRQRAHHDLLVTLHVFIQLIQLYEVSLAQVQVVY